MNEQTHIFGDEIPQVTTLGRHCEWCTGAASEAFEIRHGRGKSRSQLFIYACPTHRHLAATFVDAEDKP